MGQGALSKPVVQWWLSLNSSTPTQGELTGNELLVVASRRRRRFFDGRPHRPVAVSLVSSSTTPRASPRSMRARRGKTEIKTARRRPEWHCASPDGTGPSPFICGR